MRKIFNTMLLFVAATVGMGTFVSCSDDDDLANADALFRPIITDDNIEMGLDENLVPYTSTKISHRYTLCPFPLTSYPIPPL